MEESCLRTRHTYRGDLYACVVRKRLTSTPHENSSVESRCRAKSVKDKGVLRGFHASKKCVETTHGSPGIQRTFPWGPRQSFGRTASSRWLKYEVACRRVPTRSSWQTHAGRLIVRAIDKVDVYIFKLVYSTTTLPPKTS